MDLKAILERAKAQAASMPQTIEIDQKLVNGDVVTTVKHDGVIVNGAPPIEIESVVKLCACGHPESVHDDDSCIIDCECEGFVYSGEIQQIEEIPVVVDESQAAVSEATGEGQVQPSLPAPTIPQKSNLTFLPTPTLVHPIGAPHELQKMRDDLIASKQAPFTIPPSDRMLEGKDADPADWNEDMCHHLCEKCTKWWTHGDHAQCRYPSEAKQGLCPDCLGGAKNEWNPDKEIKLGVNGEVRLTPEYEVAIRNRQRDVIKNMSIQQKTDHIRMLHKRIEEMRAAAQETRRARAEDEEEALAGMDSESEREAFRQELRQGAKKVKRGRSSDGSPKAKKQTTAERVKELATSLTISVAGYDRDVIAKMMISTGKNQAQVEDMIYGD